MHKLPVTYPIKLTSNLPINDARPD